MARKAPYWTEVKIGPDKWLGTTMWESAERAIADARSKHEYNGCKALRVVQGKVVIAEFPAKA